MASNTSITSNNSTKPKRVKRIIKSSNLEVEETLKDAFEEFIREKEGQNKAYSTIRNYKQSFNFFYEFHEFDETTLVKDIEKGMIYEWIQAKAQEDISESSLNHYIRDVRTFLYWCMDEPREWLSPFKIKERAYQEEKPKQIEDEDLELLLVKPRGRRDKDFTEWRSYAIVCWIAGTGNRAGTVSEVRIGDLDFKKKEITLKHTKNKKAQGIPFSDSLKTTMREYIKLYRNDTGEEDYLFCNIGGERLTYNAMRLAHERYCNNRGCSNRSLHALRHTFAKNYMSTGGDLLRLQRILGHSSIAVTKRYVSLMIDDLKDNYEAHSLLDVKKKNAKRTKRVSSSED